MNSEEKKYKNLMKQDLSTLAYRLKKLATQGTLTHGNKGEIYQIPPMSKRSPAVKKCIVKETLSGHISITYRDRSFPDILPLQTVQI